NPEHPPLLKMIATLPLMPLTLNVPALKDRDFKQEAFLSGKDFLYSNDADAILIRVRMTAAVFTLLCAVFVFLGTKEMFGSVAAFIALALLVFDPNIIAHGAYVTTDSAASCMMFATVYAFYRYVKKPSWQRLIFVGLALGIALAVKHSAVLLFPILLILAIIELFRNYFEGKKTETEFNFGKQIVKTFLSLAAVTLISLVILWSFYGFRYEARPNGLALNPTFSEFTKNLKPAQGFLINTTAKFKLLPESYLYGMADVFMTSYPSFVLGKTYPESVWFYFPVVFVIKSTLAVLAFFLLILISIAARRFNRWREIIFLTIPPLVYLLVAMNSGTNIGVRHILVIYVFLAALAGGAAWAIISANRKWIYPVLAVLLFHLVTSATTFPYYLAYSNEFWGGKSNTYKYLSDSNIDWAEQLKQTKQYLDAKNIKECWFVYFGGGIAEPDYYGIPCKPLPTVETLWLNQRITPPPAIDGIVLMSAVNLTGFEFGPGKLNPYEQFKQIQPKDRIGQGVFVFEGHFEIPQVAALGHIQNAQNLLAEKQIDQALTEARKAVELDPESVSAHETLADALTAAEKQSEALAAYEKAVQIAKTVEPVFQAGAVSRIEQKLKGN
ncbi:MAG TPA: glycosyltransferase family 39 protein, partial [Pyrinomonadaceae bacterium]|nr:glycosyltransferase family 39 protein [Pyrinomonadaceae bacterium]